ncbi:hypothetical protein ACIBU0_35685 [Streptomyces sp. NPDC049627]|uniref:hypothetical protein n=1 Tax=Streptomyces sp. NPDC049627 TaxID=3365595 RepID=UPI00378C75F7
MNELPQRVLGDSLGERHERWSRTQKSYLLVSRRPATGDRRPPITEAHLHRLLQ